jgi:hypothetical protein
MILHMNALRDIQTILFDLFTPKIFLDKNIKKRLAS